MKYCIDCEFYIKIERPAHIYRSGHQPDAHKCRNPIFMQNHESLVTGNLQEQVDCYNTRKNETLCGTDGKGFVAKIKQKKKFWVF